MSTLLAWNPDDRPRERLAALGPAALSDAELLALLLGSGRAGENVVAVAGAMLVRLGGLDGVCQASETELCAQPGVGPVRASVIHAACELGRRAAGARPRRGARLGAAAEVCAHLRARLAHAPVEEFWVLALDVRHRLQFEMCAARGSLSSVEVHPRDVFRPLIRQGASATIFCHNHPSGDHAPSQQDMLLTVRLCEVGELCGIPVLDHVVVASEGYTSFAEHGWL